MMTSNVLEWLIHFNIPFLRINREDSDKIILKLSDANPQELIFNVYGNEYKTKDIRYTWYRRGLFKSINKNHFSTFSIPEAFKDLFQNHLHKEITSLHDLFYFFTKDKCLNHPKDYFLNKLIVLSCAQQAGLRIPPYIVTGKKTDVLAFQMKYESIITKTIQDNLVIKQNNYECSHFTLRMTKKSVHILADTFPNSFFQKEIQKKYEVRVFFLDGDFFSIAHFNHTKEKGVVDGKHIQQANGKLNRLTSFNLPDDLKNKIKSLMKALNINSGSLDFILTPNLEFYFLEVNPVGQFGFVSTSANYYIDLKIAKHLQNKYYEKC